MIRQFRQGDAVPEWLCVIEGGTKLPNFSHHFGTDVIVYNRSQRYTVRPIFAGYECCIKIQHIHDASFRYAPHAQGMYIDLKPIIPLEKQTCRVLWYAFCILTGLVGPILLGAQP